MSQTSKSKSTRQDGVHHKMDQNNSQKLKNDDTTCDGKYCFFWQTGSPFSQWHPSKYELNGTQYCCAEQGMMHCKAILFCDETIAEKILEASSPREMKTLGRMVRGFEPDVWDQNRERIVHENSVAKFTQNPHLLEALLNTQGCLLVEASPYDKIWGIGLNRDQARNIPSNQWPGLNLLGKILTKVRDEIVAEMKE